MFGSCMQNVHCASHDRGHDLISPSIAYTYVKGPILGKRPTSSHLDEKLMTDAECTTPDTPTSVSEPLLTQMHKKTWRTFHDVVESAFIGHVLDHDSLERVRAIFLGKQGLQPIRLCQVSDGSAHAIAGCQALIRDVRCNIAFRPAKLVVYRHWSKTAALPFTPVTRTRLPFSSAIGAMLGI